MLTTHSLTHWIMCILFSIWWNPFSKCWECWKECIVFVTIVSTSHIINSCLRGQCFVLFFTCQYDFSCLSIVCIFFYVRENSIKCMCLGKIETPIRLKNVLQKEWQYILLKNTAAKEHIPSNRYYVGNKSEFWISLNLLYMIVSEIGQWIFIFPMSLYCATYFMYCWMQDPNGSIDDKSENRLYIGNLDLRITEWDILTPQQGLLVFTVLKAWLRNKRWKVCIEYIVS